MFSINQKYWCRALSLIPAEELKTVIDSVSPSWRITPKTLPLSGLGLIEVEDSALHDRFYLGEIPVTTAWVDVQTDDAQNYEGYASTMDDDLELTEYMAIADAIVANQLPGHEKIEHLILQGMKVINKEKLIRKDILLQSRVEFDLLETAD
jgi:alpha-D-ribose 1-methylphosphonate 5-triphosphate synthase subunit PhnG